MQVEQLESEAAPMLFPTKEERVQDVEEDNVTEMSTDECHWDLNCVIEV